MRYGFLLLVGRMEGEEAKMFSIPADCVKPRIVLAVEQQFLLKLSFFCCYSGDGSVGNQCGWLVQPGLDKPSELEQAKACIYS